MRYNADLVTDSGRFMQRVHEILDPHNRGLLNEAQINFFGATSVEAEKFDVSDRDNPVMRLVNHIGNYWRHSVLVILSTNSYRPSTIVKLLNALDPSRPISQRMLCLSLRTLQRDGLVSRQSINEKVKHVEYSLTPLGEQLVEKLMPVLDWIVENAEQVVQARKAFDADDDGLL